MASKTTGLEGKSESRGTIYYFDPRKLEVEPGFNVRDFSTKENKADLQELKESIRKNGLRTPMTIRLDGDHVYVVSGERRYRSIMELIDEGEDIPTVKTISENKGTSEETRLFGLEADNESKQFSDLEKALLYERLIARGHTSATIADRLGKSVQTIDRILKLSGAPDVAKQLVRDGKISVTSLIDTLTKHDSSEKVMEVLERGVAKAESLGKTKATAKTLDDADTIKLTRKQQAIVIQALRDIAGGSINAQDIAKAILLDVNCLGESDKDKSLKEAA